MPNKINLRDYDLTPAECRLFVDFGLWLQANPNGGLFTYAGRYFWVDPLESLFKPKIEKV